MSRRALAVRVVLVALAASAVIELPGPPPAAAGPVVNVLARTRIEIDGARRSNNQMVVRGRIVEASTGAPVPNVTVWVKVGDKDRSDTSNERGAFRVSFELAEGAYRASASFRGDGEYAAAEVSDFRFDLGKETPALTLTVPSEIEAGRPLEGAVESSVGREPMPMTVRVSIGPATGAAREVLSLTTDDAGRAAFAVPAEAVGGAGEKYVRVDFPGDETLNPIAGEALVRVMSNTRIDGFQAPPGAVAYEDSLVVSGRLLDETDAGVAGQAIAISAGGERVGGTRTGADGSFEARLKASRFAPGSVTLSAEYLSTTPWRRGARTPPVTVTIAEPRPVPIAYTIFAFALTFAVVLGFVVARTRPWLPLLAWVSKWRARGRPGSGPVAAAPGDDPDAAPATGLKPGRPTLMSTLRRPADAVVSGTVRDVLTGKPIPGVQLDFVLEGQPTCELVTDAEGRFELGPLHAGVWKAHARAPGFVTERFSATVPHRGELRDVRIDLMPVREQVFVIYRGVALRLLPRRELWGVWTPREILDHVRKRRASGALGELTNFVEEAYFSARVPDEAVLSQAQKRAAAAKAELGTAES